MKWGKPSPITVLISGANGALYFLFGDERAAFVSIWLLLFGILLNGIKEE